MAELKYHAANRHATWLELFLDLVFVASIGVVTHHLAHTEDGRLDWHHVALFVSQLIPVWWVWATHTLYSNRFDADTRGHRAASLVIMFLMVTMTSFLSDDDSSGFIVLYVVIRCALACMYLSASNRLPGHGMHTRRMAAVIAAGALVSLASLMFADSARPIVLLLAIALEMIAFVHLGTDDALVAIHRRHLVERVGLLSIIMLGESVISMVAGLRDIEPHSYNIAAAGTGFMMLVSIWWIYFDSFDILERASRFHRGFILLYSHLLFLLGLGLIASVIGHTIRNDIVMSDFRHLAILGTVLIYLGKQISYFVAFPPYRTNILINSSVCLAATAASTFAPRPEYALVGITLTLMLYSCFNLCWTLTKDVSPYVVVDHPGHKSS